MTADMNVKIGSCTKLCTLNMILATKTKSQTTKDFRFRTSYLEKVDSKRLKTAGKENSLNR